jgi:hypothetical protein
MNALDSYPGHSADVSIGLLINGAWLPVAELGPDFLFLRAGVEHPPCDVVLRLRVDGQQRQWRVGLPEGISAGCDRVALGFPKGDLDASSGVQG